MALIDMQSPHAREFGAHPSPGIKKLFCESDVLRPWGASGSEPLVRRHRPRPAPRGP